VFVQTKVLKKAGRRSQPIRLPPTERLTNLTPLFITDSINANSSHVFNEVRHQEFMDRHMLSSPRKP
jgi:hypothetical protein